MKLFTLTLQHPDKLTSSAVVNVWFMDNGDIVLGGFGWFEKFDYEELMERKK